MYLMIFYFFFMVISFIFLSGITFVIYYFMQDYMIEWMILSSNTMMMEIFVFFDWIACLFISFVLMISFSVILYSVIYMSGDKNMKRFLYLVIMFIISMIMMIISPSLVSILFGWDMLGLVSYCLIIYYQSVKSFNSGMVTVLTNRIGDVGMLMCIGLLLMNGSWNWYMISGGEWLIMMMIFLASVTKSAQMPFSSWLPLAMAAPTPVSSLVHSSTLVTAGVYLILRFNDFLVNSLGGSLLFVSVLTMLMSGFMAIFECDLKKVIALSTLSQLGFMMMILSLGLKMLGFFHLLTHAVFKSLLFLCAGVVIHSMKDSQDIRFYGNLSGGLPFVSSSFYISVMALMGMPFLAGFYSKDLILESLYTLSVNILMIVLIFFSLIFTVVYSLRLCFYLFFGSMKVWIFNMKESGLMNFSMVVLMVMSLSSGAVLSWLFFFDQEINHLNEGVKMLVFLIFISSLGFCWMMGMTLGYSLMGGSWMKVKMKKVIFFLTKMWLLNFLHLSLSKIVLLGSKIKSDDDLEWLEIFEGKMIFIMKFMIMKLYLMNFKVYKLILIEGGLLMFLLLFYFML